MAHGFGCTRGGGVAPFAERFAAAVSQGTAVDGLAILRKPEKADANTPRSKGSRSSGR